MTGVNALEWLYILAEATKACPSSTSTTTDGCVLLPRRAIGGTSKIIGIIDLPVRRPVPCMKNFARH
jgi:hypothetical protein